MRRMWNASIRSILKPEPGSSVSELHYRRDDCRLCGGGSLTSVLTLTPTPPANAFVSADEREEAQQAFPLEVFFCDACAHLQLLDVVDPRLLFENYVYVSGTSAQFVKHFEEYAGQVLARVAPPPGSLVVDIGSNDGTLLGFYKSSGMKVLGVDPAKKIATEATERGIETIVGFFTAGLAREIRDKRGPARVITANNLFAHVDDLGGLVEGVRGLLDEDGVFVFEVSYLMDVVRDTLFDTIYHEHLDYHSVLPLKTFFAANGMELIGAQPVPTHGGSLRAMAQLAGGPHALNGPGGSVEKMIAQEKQAGLDRAETFLGFADQIDQVRRELVELLGNLKSEGKKIAAFGAPAKATTLMYHFGIGPEIIDFIADDSPLKQGLYSPGLHIPVLSGDEIAKRKPDYLVILAWNFAEPIMKNYKFFQQGGGRFIVPLPQVKVC